jgi:hypothetical protein
VLAYLQHLGETDATARIHCGTRRRGGVAAGGYRLLEVKIGYCGWRDFELGDAL